MSTNGANETSTQPPRLTADEAALIWQAHNAYDVREGLWTMVRVVFGLELMLAFFQGTLLRGLVAIAAQFVLLVVAREALRVVARRVGRVWRHWLRAYAHRQRQQRVQRGTLRQYGSVLMLALALSALLSGCQDMARGVARLYGYTGDPFPGPCAPESVKVGYCMPAAQQPQPQGEQRQ